MFIRWLFHTSHLYRFGVSFICSISLGILGIILWFNQGFFTYTLDDPYIHLALAQNLAQGHYGINTGEFSAPSSSIIWPFLLTPLARTQLGLYWPLLISVISSLGTVWVYSAIIDESLQLEGHNRLIIKKIILVWLILATNMVGLIFLGMEHSLQVLCVSIIVYGLWQYGRTHHPSRYLLGALILAPLIRYDNMAIVVPALLYLLWHRANRPFWIATVTITITVGGFSLFLLWLGLDILPDSISVKSNVVSGHHKLEELWLNLRSAWRTLPGFWLSLGGIGLWGLAWWRKEDQQASRFACCLGLGVILHLLVGRFGWFSRYEIYIWTAVLLSLIYMVGPKLKHILDRQPIGRISYIALLSLLLVSTPYLLTQIRTPLAANNIYEQHYQMHRFAVTYYQGPFAVHDLGYVAYNNNDYYVLDLWGLASPGAFEKRRLGNNQQWLAGATQEREVGLVMIFDGVFPDIPPEWQAIAKLNTSRPKAMGSSEAIVFYATSQESAVTIHNALKDMEPALPANISFEFE